MKKTLLYLAGAAALLAGCAKEVPVDEPVLGQKTITIQASIDPETRTTVEINDNKGVYSWVENEKILVIEANNKNESLVPQLFTVADAANGLFTGTLQENCIFGGAVSPSGAGEVVNYQDGVVSYNLWMYGNYYYTGGTNAIMVAGAPTLIGDQYKFTFKHAAALFKVTYENVPVGTKKLSITTDQPMTTGEFTGVTFDSFENVEIKVSDLPSTGSKTISVTLNEAVSTVNQTMTFYAPIPTGTYGSVSVSLLDADDNVIEGTTKSKTKSFEVERADIIALPTITLEATLVEKYYVKVTKDEDIVAGDYLIVYEAADEGTILTGVSNKIGTISETPVTILEGNKIAQAGNEAYNIVVEEGNEGYTMKLGDGYLAYNLAAGTTKNNNLFLVETASETGAEWILSADGIQNAYNTERYLQFNKDRFACYTGTQQDVSLYLLEGSGSSSGKKPAALSYAITEYEITLGDEFTTPELTNPNSLTVTYASNNTEVATVNETSGEVTILAVGTAKITASFAGNDEYKAGSAFYTITVNPVKDYIFYESFDKFTGTGGNDGSWNGSIASNNWGTTDNTGWTVENANSANKCAKFGTGSKLGSAMTPALGITDQTTATLTFKAGAWNASSENTTLNISIEGNGQASVKSVTLVKGEFTDYTVVLGNGIDATTKIKFAAAKASNNRFFLDEVKVVAGSEMPVVKQDPTLSFSKTEVEATLGADFTAPTLTTDPAGLTVTYASSKPEFATVNENTGVVTLVAAGTTTITATFAGNDNYNEASASYTLKISSGVDNGKGTLESPFNIAGVYEYINISGSENVYVKGIISSIANGGEYSEDYGNATFYISDDGSTTTDQFEANRVLFIGNNKWKEGNTQIKVGDEVILYGKVIKHGETYETSANNAYVYSLNGVTTMLSTPVATIDTNDAAKEISVSWVKVDHATSYEVSCGEQVYTAGENETSHTFTMTAYGDYDVQIIARGAGYEAGISDIKTAKLSDPSVSYTEVAAQTFTFSEMGYSNGAEVSTVSGTTNCSIVFNKGTNSNAPKYYTSGTAVRAYGGNTITVTASKDYQISTIKLSFGSSDGSNEITVNSGEYKDGVWTGKINNGGSVVFTIEGTSGHRRISAIAINPAE